MSSLEKEREFIRQAASTIVGATFESSTPPPDYPVQAEKVEWFLECREMAEAIETPPVNAIWKESEGFLWLGTLPIGNTVTWTQAAYGEESVSETLAFDFSKFDEGDFQGEFGRRFPLVLRRIKKYEAIAARISSKMNVQLEIRRVGSQGMLVLSLAAKMRIDRLDKSTRDRIATNVEALREACHEIFQV